MPVDLPNPARASVRPLSDPIPVPPPAELTGPWTPQTLASAGDSTGANRPLIPLAPGQTPHVPGYELLGILGRGGMGVVYRARQTKLNRIVALKMILGDRSDPKDLIRFLAEAEAVAAVRHPHVVQVYEYGDAEGQPFLALEYLPGGSLADHLKFRGRMVPEAAAEVVRKLAIGIQAVHDHGIVHRDLKPANVLFDESGEPKVADFGLAKRDDHHDLTARDAVMGTPAFMAPEQAAGGTKFVGPAADIYSLGVILYVCLTGKRPFEDTDALSLLRKVIDVEPDRPRKHVPMLPRDLELICLKCLAKVPHERYLTAKALADDLSNFSGGRPVSVRPAGVVERGVKWARRKPVVAAAYGLTAVSLLLAGLVVGAVWLWQNAATARDEAEQARTGEEEARGIAVAARGVAEQARDAERSAKAKVAFLNYAHAVDLAHREYLAGNIARARELLDACPVELRHWEWGYVHRLCHSDLVTIRGHTGHVYSAIFSPDCSRVLTRSRDGTVRIWDAESGVALAVLEHPESIDPSILEHARGVFQAEFSTDGKRVFTTARLIGRAWDAHSGKPASVLRDTPKSSNWSMKPSPDARRVAVVYGNLARILDTDSGGIISTLTGHTNIIRSVSFSADGTRVATSSNDQTARIWDVESGKSHAVLTGHTGFVWSCEFSPDGQRILTSSYDKTARVWDTASGSQLTLIPGGPDGINSVVATPDWKWLVATGQTGVASIMNLETGKPATTLQGVSENIRTASISNDGNLVVTTSKSSNAAQIWDAKSGKKLSVLQGHTAPLQTACFSGDATRVLTSSEDGTARIWSASPSRSTILLKGHTSSVMAAAFSPDCTQLVTSSASYENSLRVWRLDAGEQLALLKGHVSAIYTVSYSPDGKKVLSGSLDGTSRIWDVESQRQLTIMKGHVGRVISVAFSPDATRVVTGARTHTGPGNVKYPADDTARIWDAGTGQQLALLRHDQGVESVAFTPDGTKVISGSAEGTIRIWDAESARDPSVLKGHSNWVRSLAISRDGQRLASASGDRSGIVWDLAAGTQVERLVGHTGLLDRIAFSNDGKRLVTGSRDQTLRVWDAGSGKLLLTLPGYTDTFAVAFTPDDKQVIAAGSNDTWATVGLASVFDTRPVNREYLKTPDHALGSSR